MEDEWEELETLCREIEEAGSPEAAERRNRLRAHLEALTPALDVVGQHVSALDPEGALARIRDRLLGGAGVIQQTVLEHGLDRLTVLAWGAAADPRPEMAGARGEYQIEIWLGLSETGRPRVRVVGAKRLEAALPVAVEKFRSVLLGAVRAPKFSPYPAEEEHQPEGAAEAAEQAAAEPEPPSHPETAAAEAGRREEMPSPPADDEPIPMGPAAGAEPGHPPDT